MICPQSYLWQAGDIMITNLRYKPKIMIDIKNLSEKEWLSYRKKGIGGSDAAAAVGSSPYKTMRELYYEKINKEKLFDNNINWVTFEVGHRLEDLVAEIFAKKTGYRVFKDTNMYCHSRFPFMLADIDFLYETPNGEVGILETKTSNYYNKEYWNHNKIPYHYELQVRHYMSVMNISHGWIACLFGNHERDFEMRELQRDLLLEEQLIQQEDYFWNEYVLKRQEPPFVEDAEMALNCMMKYMPLEENSSVFEIPDTYDNMMDRLLQLREEKADLEKQKRKIEAEIKGLYAPIIEAMNGKTQGIYQKGDSKILLEYKPEIRISIPKAKLEQLREIAPDLYYQYAELSEIRKVIIKEEKRKKEKEAAYVMPI